MVGVEEDGKVKKKGYWIKRIVKWRWWVYMNDGRSWDGEKFGEWEF